MLELNRIYNADCITAMQELPNNSVDCIFTDPPYKYLKNQKLEVDFDEKAFFAEANRVLKKGGFIALFGRGSSFYRWNTMLADMGYEFKEEIVWDKGHCTSPLMSISRVHETISIHSKGKAKITKVKVPYLKMKAHDIPGIVQDIKRLKTVFSNTKSFDAVKEFLENNVMNFKKTETQRGYSTSVQDYKGTANRHVATMLAIQNGMNEKSIIRQKFDFQTSVLKVTRDHYDTIHPTQKPVDLLQRILALISKQGDLVLDPFSGSASTAIACINTKRNFIGFELDKEYFLKAKDRIEGKIL